VAGGLVERLHARRQGHSKCSLAYLKPSSIASRFASIRAACS
jgi:hypothetical protein